MLLQVFGHKPKYYMDFDQMITPQVMLKVHWLVTFVVRVGNLMVELRLMGFVIWEPWMSAEKKLQYFQ